MKQPERIYGLDILRAIAILLVIYWHGFIFLSQIIPQRFLEYFLFDGVSVFFVLSGYLIGGVLIRTIEKNGIEMNVLFDFWVRRWFRIIPTYFLILTVLIFYSDTIPEDIYKYFLFIQNLASEQPGFFKEAWSLSVEEWFYFFIPVSMFLLLNFKLNLKKTIMLTACSIIAFSFIYRCVRFFSFDILSFQQWDSLFRTQVVTQMDSLMIGVIAAYFSCFYPEWVRNKNKFLFAGLILLFSYKLIFLISEQGYNNLYLCVFSFSHISIGTALLLPFLSEIRSGKGFFYRTVTFISVTSYSAYLTNITVRNFFKDYFYEQHPLLKFSGFVVCTFILSYFIYRFFESPITRLRELISVDRIRNILSLK